MGLRKRVIIAAVTGIAISGFGIGLVALGGWGPCGPASTFAAIGGWLTIAHVEWLSRLIPGLERFLGKLHAELLFLILWPTLLWATVAFCILSLWKIFRTHEHQVAQAP